MNQKIIIRWLSSEPNNLEGDDLNVLAEGCVIYNSSLNGLDDYSCAAILSFLCEYRNNQTMFTCPSNLYYENNLGCGWFYFYSSVIFEDCKFYLFFVEI